MPHNNDDFMGEDVEVGLVTDLRPEYAIQKVHKSGSSKMLTLQIKNAWSYRMGLKPHDYVFMEISADASEIKFKKVTPQKFKDNFYEDAEPASAGEVENAGPDTVPLHLGKE
jgi:hypothetical protein